MISVIIPTYKNKAILLKNLRHNVSYLKDCEIIVVNDDPEESLKSNLKEFKNINLIENKKNLGFGTSVNRGIGRTKNKLVMLINSDVVLNNMSYQIAINHFKKNPTLFAVGFAQKEKDGTIVGKNQTYWQKGMFMHRRADDLFLGETAWAEGGACIIDREKFLKLDGFDPIYSPFYWEDIDLSFRAKKAGYQVIFDPKIQVEHHHESTIGKYFRKDDIQKIAFRNQLIFIWKNIAEPKQKLSHFLFLPYHLLRYTLVRNKEFLLGFIEAIRLSFRPRAKSRGRNLI